MNGITEAEFSLKADGSEFAYKDILIIWSHYGGNSPSGFTGILFNNIEIFMEYITWNGNKDHYMMCEQIESINTIITTFGQRGSNNTGIAIMHGLEQIGDIKNVKIIFPNALTVGVGAYLRLYGRK